MKHLILTLALSMGVAATAMAGELDNERGVTNRQLNGTVIIRVDTRTNEASAIQVKGDIKDKQQAQAIASKGNFAPAPVRNELDRDGGASSWYYYPGYGYGYGYNYGYGYGYGYGYNNMNWYGNWYRPCYNYNYGYYNYYYYNSYGYAWAY